MAKVSTLEGWDKNCQNSVHVVCTRTLTGTYFELFRARSSTKIWVLIAQLCSNYCLMNNVVGNYLEHRSVDILVSQYSIICNDLILDMGIRKSQWYGRYIVWLFLQKGASYKENMIKINTNFLWLFPKILLYSQILWNYTTHRLETYDLEEHLDF